MPKSLYARARVKALAVALTGLFVILTLFSAGARPVQAAASSNLNFQARLFGANGTLVADGTYNIDFKLYTADSTTGSVGTCTGACVWEETRTGSNKVQVIGGYFSVNLGSVTAFPSTINWDQQLWLTMNIGGTGASPVWDGEMQNAGHSIALTALPYAFTAGQLATGTGTSRGTLNFASFGQATAITLPDPGASTATVCYQGSAACNFIQNGTGLQTNANFNIQSVAVGSIGAIIQGASGQTADLFQLKNSSTVFSVGNNGQTLFKPTASNDSQTFFQVQPSGSTTPIFDIDTQNGRVGIGGVPNNGTSTLQVIGAISATNTTDSQKIVVNVNHGGAYGIDFYNDTASRVSYIHNNGSSSGGLAFCTSSTTSSCALGQEQFILDASNGGAAKFRVSSDSASAFQVQDSTGSQVFALDTASTSNLVTNGSFESNNTGWAAKGATTFTQNTSFQYIGKGSLAVVTPATANTGVSYAYGLSSNTEYALTVYARTAPGTTMGTLQIGYSQDGSTDSSCLTGQSVNSNWGQYTCIFDTGTVSGTPYIYVKQTDATARTFYIDGVQLTQFGVLANPSAEQSLTGNWAVKGSATIAQDATQFVNGSKSLKATVTAAGGGTKQNITLADSTTYYLSLYLAATSTASSSYEIGYSSDGSTDNTVCASQSVTVIGNGWTKIGCTFVTPASHSGTPYFYVKQNDTNAPGFYLDGVRLTVGAPVLQYTEGRVALNGIVSSPLTIQNQADSVNALQVQNASGTTLLNLDSTSGSLNINHTSTSGTILTLTSTQAGDASAYLKAVSNGGTVRATIDANGIISARQGTSSTVSIGSGNVPTLALNNFSSVSAPASGQVQINGAGTVSTLIVQGQASQSSDFFDLIPNGTSTPLTKFNNNGDLVIGSANSAASATALQVQNAAGNSVLGADTSANQVLLGKVSSLSGKLAFASSGGGTITINAGTTANTYSLTLPTSGPALSQCLQNDGTTLGQLVFGPCGANGTFLSKNATDTSSADAGLGYLYGFTNSGSAGSGGTLKLDNGNNTGSTLSATTSGNPAAGKAVIYGQNTNASPSGNLLDLESGSTPSSKFSVDAAGNVTAAGKYNTNTFTGSSLIFGAAAAASVQSASSQALNITSNATALWQVAGTNQNLTIQTSGTGTLAIDTAGAGILNLGNGQAVTVNIGNNNTTSILIGGSSVLGTITTKASGITQTITGSATTPSEIIKTSTNSSGAFQIQNSSSQRVFGVDTSANQILLGQSNALNGALLFQNSSSNNGITINSTGANSNYTLTLPTSAPAGGLCIETSTSNSSQLVFASCSNNNASIQEVHEWDANNSTTVPVSPTTVGDEMVLTTQIPTSGVTVTSVSGGGVASWNKIVTSAGNGTVNRVEMWGGTVTSTGNSTITVTYSSSAGANEITATEFTAAGVNSSTSWGIESSASQLNSTASTTVTYPNATAVNGSELYIGYAQVQNPPATSGSSTGFNYIITSTQHNAITYNTSLAANTSYQPTANQNSAGQSNTVEAVLTAFVTSTSINNTTSLQKANFYVQAATGGSVAGILQAASSGTADIMDLRNSGGTNVLTVGSTGNLLLQPSASTTALQVQNSSNYSVMAVDTSGNQLVLGDATHLSGKITFKDSGDTNTISIVAPSSVAASYNLTLPTNTPTGGLCLGTSPSNANQLIFASCATQVSAASITYVNQWSSNGTSITTLADSPVSTGNLLVLYSHATNNVTISGVSGGGVTNWTKVTGNVNTTGQGNNEMWRGVVTGTGSATITVTYSAAAGANEIVAQEYTMGGTGGGTWAIDTSGTAINSGAQTVINYPSLTPANSSELYAGYAWSQNTMSAGTSTGFTYTTTTGGKYTAYNTSVTGSVATQPTASQTVAGNYNSIAAVIQAFAGTSVIVNSTATQQANFNVQAALSGTVAGVLQGASSGSADVLQVKDGTGVNIMTVNGSSGITLSTSNSTGGQLNFVASGNGNVISILTPNAPGSSYNLTLPTTTPAPGQCLATSPSNANQLVFSSCANQVTSVAINFVNNWKTSGGATINLAVSPTSVNNLMTAFISMNKADNVSSISGGGVTTWSKVSGTGSGSGNDTTSIEMWRGVVTSTGASTISVTIAGPTGTHEVAAMEFSTGSTTGSWVVDSSNTQFNSSASTTMTFPSLTPQSSKDLYVGYGASASNFSTGSSSGFTYLSGSLSNRVGLYNTSVSTTTQPTATTVGSGISLTVGALVAAYSSSSVISNSTVTQQGNFNVQAATSGSVAGVLQAYGGGTGDIFDLLNGSGALVGSFSSTGNLLVKPSTASAAAFQVQTTGNINVLSADTSSKLVVVGAGATGETTPSLLVLDNQTGSSADPTEINGAMYYNATTHSFRCGVAGAWQNCSGLLYANSSQSSANSNCSNNCTAFSTAASIPANYCQAGRVIKLTATGFFSSQASASQLQFGVYYGTDGSVASNDTLIGSLTPAVSVTSASNNYFQMDFNITCFSTSSMQAGGILSLQAGSAAAGVTALPMNSTSSTTVVTSTAKNLYIFPIWDTASASNTATITQFGVSAP